MACRRRALTGEASAVGAVQRLQQSSHVRRGLALICEQRELHMLRPAEGGVTVLVRLDGRLSLLTLQHQAAVRRQNLHEPPVTARVQATTPEMGAQLCQELVVGLHGGAESVAVIRK